MKKRKVLMRLPAVMFTVMFCAGNVFSQTADKLGIGDQAPELKYSKWIKGDPIKSMDGEQLYILEFWATWCGPCKAAMPHLTELQKQYKGKATFIGVGVLEKVPADQPYESSLPAVEKYVKGNDANMGYSVIADNSDQYMSKRWLKAAGQNGIPATFIVKDKKVIWIGHPNSLDTIIPKVLSGKYNIDAVKAKYNQQAEAGRKQMEQMAAMFKPIEDAIKAKEYQKSFELMDKMAAEQPNFKPAMDGMKFRVLLTNVGEKEAMEFAREWQKTSKSAPSLILGEVYNKDGLAKDTYLWAAANFGNTDAVTNPIIFDALASCYAKGGDFKSAVVMQQKALTFGEKALKEGSMVGTIMDYTIKEFQDKLKQYQGRL